MRKYRGNAAGIPAQEVGKHERTVLEREAEVSRREKVVCAREDAMRLREKATNARQLAMAMKNATSVAEETSLEKLDFLSSMSHDLRTPLNAILGFAQLMELDSPPPTPAQRDSLNQILQAGWLLLKLTDEVLDLAVVEPCKLSFPQGSALLSEVLPECRNPGAVPPAWAVTTKFNQ